MTAELMRESGGDPKLQKSAERLYKSGTRMRQIIEELLDMSRARLSGGIPIERRSVDLLALARTAVAEAEGSHPDRKVELRCDGDMQGQWDAGRLEQVLSNLLGNALRHGAKDRPIVLRLDGEPDFVNISVHNGGHIAPELLPRVFEPFQTSRASRGQGDGLGLGLYIVQQIVLSHAGEVDVRSDPTEGTTFSLRLPRRPSTAQATATLTAANK
jgi:signal transduction histidine kinase